MQLKTFFLNALVIMVFSLSINAQTTPDPKPCIIQTMYLKMTAGPERLNIDSLLKIYKKNFIDPNPYITSSKILAHWWGHDSREVVIVCQLKSLDDLNKAFEKQRELQVNYVKNNEGFLKQWRALIADSHHSDEIYRIVAE